MADEQKAATRYLLNELTETERRDFEEHFFECPICADLVRQDFTATENLKDVLRQRPANEPAIESRTSTPWWSQWLRPPSLIPTFAALALAFVVVQQSAVTRQILFVSESGVIAPLARGAANEKPVLVPPTASRVLLTFSVDGLTKPESFLCEFQTGDGSVVAQETTPLTQSDLRFDLPSKLFPTGHYKLLTRRVSEPSAPPTIYLFAIEHSK